MSYFKELEKIIAYNLNKRGMEGVNLTGQLEKASKALLELGTILIVTGFAMKDKLTGETDGPVGTVSIAKALNLLGKSVIIVTDIYSKKIFEAALNLIDLQIPLEIIIKGDEVRFSHAMLSKYKPDCLLSIERPGEAADGFIYSMTGECISSIVPSVDYLFKKAKRQNIYTIGIGDGGNEIGMGKINHYIVNNVPNGSIIAASFSTDDLIVAGVSNWGAHALAAAMSIVCGKNLLYSSQTGARLLKTIVDVGAVDGLTKQNTLTVDGLSLDENVRILNDIKDVVRKYLEL